MMTMRSMWISSLSGGFVLLLMGMTGTQALAAGCKGLENAQCEALDGCYWVNPYQRKDGVEVSGHCRGKPSAKSSDTAKGSTETTGDAHKDQDHKTDSSKGKTDSEKSNE